MDSLPVDAIEKIENELLKKVFDIYKPESDTLFFDTTNFFTYINTTNTRCTFAQRGKNKQKRYDLRQVGLAMVVTRQDLIPLLHLTYQGNMNDTKVFTEIIGKFHDCDLDGAEIQVYRDKRVIWGNERTVIVFISERLKAGQIRGVYQAGQTRKSKFIILYA